MKYRILLVQETIIDIDAENSFDASVKADQIALRNGAKVADFWNIPDRESLELVGDI